MFVKICGTTNGEDAALSIRLGADALGFIFAPSKRQVTVGQAAEVIAGLPSPVEIFGVFTVPDIDAIVGAVREAGLTAVQLHLPHDAAFTAALGARLSDGVRLMQVVPCEVGIETEQEIAERFGEPLRGAMSDPALWAVLLDAARAGSSGGLGERFAWERARPAVTSIRAEAKAAGRTLPHLVLAGGLNAENVREAIRVLEPWGVDVVSGVEAGPGRKHPDRLAAFLAGAREEGRR